MARVCSLRMVVLVALVVVGVLAIPGGQAWASPGALKILVVEPSGSGGGCGSSSMIRSQLLAQPGVASADFFNGSTATPSVAQLDAYDIVVALSECNWADPTAMGNNLADFQDQGGVVVGATFVWEDSGGWTLKGRWITGGYSPYQTGGTSDATTKTLGTHDSTNPLLAGVNNLSASERNNLVLMPGATEIAKWSDGASAVAVKGNALGINAYIGDEAGPSAWSGDFARLILNAGNVLGRHMLSVSKAGTGSGTVESTPAGINCGPTCSGNFTNGSTVKLTESANPGSTFTGWSGGGCSGSSSSCTVTMNAAQAVTATFVSPPHHTRISGFKINKKKHTARFRFSASGAVTGWQCGLVRPKKNGKLPKKPKLVWRSCKSRKLYKHLKHGHYKFEVRAVNIAGHSTPAIKKFTI